MFNGSGSVDKWVIEIEPNNFLTNKLAWYGLISIIFLSRDYIRNIVSNSILLNYLPKNDKRYESQYIVTIGDPKHNIDCNIDIATAI